MLGRICVITGCIKSGKTRELYLMRRKYNLCQKKVKVLQFTADTENLFSNDQEMPDSQVRTVDEVGRHIDGVDVLAIDDCHVGPGGLEAVLVEASHNGRDVVVAGRDRDEKAQPYMCVARLIGFADVVERLSAVCVCCGSFLGSYTGRNSGGRLEARCSRCFSYSRIGDQMVGLGRLDVITGCMFSGKTSNLISVLQRASLARHRVVLFKPIVDKRHPPERAVSHDGTFSFDCVAIERSREMLSYVENSKPHTIGIDEAQFFDGEVVQDIVEIMERGVNVVISTLDQDSSEGLWEETVALFGLADGLRKLTAICSVCGNEANKTYRKAKSVSKVLIGGADVYEPRCHECFPH